MRNKLRVVGAVAVRIVVTTAHSRVVLGEVQVGAVALLGLAAGADDQELVVVVGGLDDDVGDLDGLVHVLVGLVFCHAGVEELDEEPGAAEVVGELDGVGDLAVLGHDDETALVADLVDVLAVGDVPPRQAAVFGEEHGQVVGRVGEVVAHGAHGHQDARRAADSVQRRVARVVRQVQVQRAPLAVVWYVLVVVRWRSGVCPGLSLVEGDHCLHEVLQVGPNVVLATFGDLLTDSQVVLIVDVCKEEPLKRWYFLESWVLV